MSLESATHAAKIERLMDRIDHALDAGDRRAFAWACQERQQLLSAFAAEVDSASFDASFDTGDL